MKKTVIVLALNASSRMKGKLPAVLQTVCGVPVLDYVVRLGRELGEQKPVLVTDIDAEEMQARFGESVRCVVKADALDELIGLLTEDDELVYVINGTMPLLERNDLERVAKKIAFNVKCSFGLGSACFKEGSVAVMRAQLMREALTWLKQHEDAEHCGVLDLRHGVSNILEEEDIAGAEISTGNDIMVYDRVQLSRAEKIMRGRIHEKLMLEGVTIIDPENTYIEDTVVIGEDTVVYPGCTLQGNTVIGKECVIYPHCRMNNAVVGEGTKVEASVLLDCKVGSFTTVGPNAYLRPKTVIGDHCRIGDFVEVKNSNIGNGTKVSHLTYVGDADLGENINLGCGVVFSNYDGKKKYRSVIGDNAFIGCNVNIVSPVNVGDDAYIAAGSTITGDVPGAALAIARERQTVKEGWVDARKAEGKL